MQSQSDIAAKLTDLEPKSYANLGNYKFLKQFVRDGAELNGVLENRANIPSLDIRADGATGKHFVWLFPEMEQFVLRYLLTGNNSDVPKYLKNGELPTFRADDDYIDRHIKREIERGSDKYSSEKETHHGIDGIRFVGKYPYGSIDYGFIHGSFEELKTRLENVEAFHNDYSEHDIPELNYNNKLPIEEKELAGEYLGSVFSLIPTNAIINKTICGCGATTLELNAPRHSIIIEPNVPVIIGKEQLHPNIIGVYAYYMTKI